MEFVAELKRKGKIHLVLDLHNHASIQSFVCFGNDLVGQHVVENGLMPKQIMAYIE